MVEGLKNLFQLGGRSWVVEDFGAFCASVPPNVESFCVDNLHSRIAIRAEFGFSRCTWLSFKSLHSFVQIYHAKSSFQKFIGSLKKIKKAHHGLPFYGRGGSVAASSGAAAIYFPIDLCVHCKAPVISGAVFCKSCLVQAERLRKAGGK